MQIYGLITELLRTYYGIKTCSWVGCGELRGWLRPDEGGVQVSPEAWGGWELWGWLRPDEGGVQVSPRALGGAGGWEGWSFWLAGS